MPSITRDKNAAATSLVDAALNLDPLMASILDTVFDVLDAAKNGDFTGFTGIDDTTQFRIHIIERAREKI